MSSVVPRSGCKDNARVLRELVERLSRLGYSEFYASFNPLGPRLRAWQAHRHDIPDQLGALVDLFLLAEAVAADRIEVILGDLRDCLVDLGLLSFTADGRITTCNLILLPVFGHWVFCQRPQTNPTLYFGDDSIALLLRLRPKRHGRCLDLCAGPGTQALQCSLFADHVSAVEINPVAAQLARLNVVMNGREDIVTIYQGNLYEPVQGRVYDTIVANPPLLPFPEDIAYPFVGHGGRDGLRITWRILHGLDAALASDGTAQLIGTCLSDGLLPLSLDALGAWASEAGMALRMTVTSHQPLGRGDVFFDGLVGTAADALKSDTEPIATAYERSLAEQGASHLCAYFLHVTRGRGTVQLQDLSRDGAPGLWYV